MASIEWCRQKLDIKTPMIFASSLNVEGSKSNLLAGICKNLKASSYLSGPSGKDYLEINLFEREGIKVEFFQPKVENYYSMLYNIIKKERK